MSILQVKDKDGNWVSIPSLQGPAGPNEITADTTTPFDGILMGEGGVVRAAVPGEDYAAAQHAPTHAIDGTDPITPGMIGALEYADLSGRVASGTFPSFDGVFEGTELEHVVLHGKSTQDGVPSPEAPVDIVSYEPGEVGVSGKNLFIRDIPAGARTEKGITCTVYEDGSAMLSGTATETIAFAQTDIRVHILAPGTYTLSGGTTTVRVMIWIYEMDGTYISAHTSEGNPKKFTITKPQRYTPVFEVASGITVPDGTMVYPQLERGDTATAWEPYTGTTYPLTLTLPGIPVDSGGTYTDETGQQYIADTYDVVTGEYVQRVQRLVLTGDEGWTTLSNRDLENTICFTIDEAYDRRSGGNHSDVMCSILPARNYAITGEPDINGIAATPAIGYEKYIDLRVPKTPLIPYGLDTADLASTKLPAWTAYLAAQYAAGTPVTVDYALAEPIITYLTPQQIPAYAPVTNISAGGGYISAKLGQAMAPVQTTPQTLTAQQKKQVYINLDIPAPTYTYGGKDLSQYMTPAELGAKIDAGDYSGICMGDYWPVTLNGTYHDFADDVDVTLADELVKLEFMPYVYGPYGDVQTPHHILVCSRDCLSKTMKMRSANDVWYDETATNPMLGSHLYQTLNAANGIIALVEQTELGPYIYAGPNGKGMRFLWETKAAGATAATGWAWGDRGKLFLPTEREVWGQDIWSEHTYGGGGNALQWPIFAGSRRHIIKGLGNGGSRGAWWCASSLADSAIDFCLVNSNGNGDRSGAASARGVPLCFLLTGPSAQTATAAETTLDVADTTLGVADTTLGVADTTTDPEVLLL